MFRMHKTIYLVLILLLSDCIAITSIKDNDFSIEKNSQLLPKKVFLECDCKFSMNGKFAEGSNEKRFIANSLNGVKRDFEKTGLFLISSESESHQYKIKIVSRVESNQNFGYNFIASMTLLILPVFGDTKRIISFEVIDSQGNLIANVNREGEQKVVLELFLIFAMPFYWPFSEENHVFARLNKSAANEIYKQIQSYEIDLNKSR